MDILKRDGRQESYDSRKIGIAIEKAFASVNETIGGDELSALVKNVELQINNTNQSISVEDIQDIVEKVLMEAGYYGVSKSYILYRSQRSKKRATRKKITQKLTEYPQLESILKEVEKDNPQEPYSLERLESKFTAFLKESMNPSQKLSALISASVELTSQDSPRWEMIASRILFLDFTTKLENRLETRNLTSFYDKVRYLTDQELYGRYILESYSKDEIDEAEKLLDKDRTKLFTYSGLELLSWSIFN